MLAFLTFPAAPPDNSVDSSLSGVLSYAHQQGIQFGPDLVFTYGPLGFLMFFYYSAHAAGLRMAVDVALCLVTAVGLCVLAWRLRPLRRWSLLILFFWIAPNVPSRGDLVIEIGLLCWGLLCFVESGPSPAGLCGVVHDARRFCGAGENLLSLCRHCQRCIGCVRSGTARPLASDARHGRRFRNVLCLGLDGRRAGVGEPGGFPGQWAGGRARLQWGAGLGRPSSAADHSIGARSRGAVDHHPARGDGVWERRAASGRAPGCVVGLVVVAVPHRVEAWERAGGPGSVFARVHLCAGLGSRGAARRAGGRTTMGAWPRLWRVRVVAGHHASILLCGLAGISLGCRSALSARIWPGC